MVILRLKANAAVIPAIIARLDALGADLPNGRTRDVVEQANLRLSQAFAMLRDEAAQLERYAAEL